MGPLISIDSPIFRFVKCLLIMPCSYLKQNMPKSPNGDGENEREVAHTDEFQTKINPERIWDEIAVRQKPSWKRKKKEKKKKNHNSYFITCSLNLERTIEYERESKRYTQERDGGKERDIKTMRKMGRDREKK